ncbi:MAG TPA: HEAT repeat domain-containing protein [Ktedonobacteraceae bacterium]|nr:HEAT repeat domain-containing protein [Ktedonobacteraceae bacterium]
MTNSHYPEPSNSTPQTTIVEAVEQPIEAMPPIGITPPQELARDAAAGHRGAAWRLLYKIMENDPHAVEAVASQKDDNLAQHLLEFIAFGTWAGKHFVIPPPLRSSYYARTRLYTLFLPESGMPSAQAQRVLFQAAREQHPAFREAALSILSVMSTPDALPVLQDALHDPIQAVRLQAIKGLERLKLPATIPALTQALSGADEQTTIQIFTALASIGHPAVPTLLNLSASPSAWIRWNCMRALSKISDYRSIPALTKALRDADHGVAWMAAKGLVDFGALSIEPVLRSLTGGEITPWLVETAAHVLSSQRNPQVRPYLAPLLTQMHSFSYMHTGISYLAHRTLNQMLDEGIIKQISRQKSN